MLRGSISKVGTLSATITGAGTLSATLAAAQAPLPDTYPGPYQVTPLARERTVLQTAHLLMAEDVTVVEVPYWETSNEAGGATVYIAQEA